MARPISLIPATLREASLDSPTFRGTILHYAEQIDLIEKWLDGFIKASTKLVNEVLGLEDPINNFLLRVIPSNISESVVDHDYTLLAMQRYAEGSKGFWTNVIVGAKKVENLVVEPLLTFQRGELKSFKEARRLLDAAQTKYDALLARYLTQNKSKEPSALREDAFGLYEARKAYIKTCFDFCTAAPLFRSKLDRLLTKVISNQWREQMSLRKDTGGLLERCGSDINRIRSCYDSMEVNENVFLKQLTVARTELEKRTKREHQPARELDEYSTSTVPYLTSRAGVHALEGDEMTSEKQGWLFMRTLTGKPTRSFWIRRWFFVKAGIFGWLVQGYRGGGAEESEKVGVLLCNIKPAFQEERRFCFEVKTKNTTILLQAETQADLTSWLAVFEQAKRAAVESSHLVASTQAFSILPPSAPAPPSEPAYITKGHDGNTASSVTPAAGDSLSLNPLYLPRHLRRDGRDEDGLGIERASTMGPSIGGSVFSRAASMDISRVLDASSPQPGQHRKMSSVVGERNISPTGPGAPAGISALIAASHNVLPFQPDSSKTLFLEPSKPTSLAPNTLSSTPSPANLLTAATVTSGSGVAGISDANRERGHRKTVSLDHGRDPSTNDGDNNPGDFPGYPLELKVQDEHFRMLFSGTGDNVVLLVFRAIWSPNDTQELPGRCFVTDRNLYFYSHYLGLVFTHATPLSTVTEVKAAPDKECDYLFLHLKSEGGEEDSEKPDTLITIKIFLEPLKLLQRRLYCLVKNANRDKDSESPKLSSRQLLPKLIAMENEAEQRGADEESWEDVSMYLDGHADPLRRRGTAEEFKLRINTDGIATSGEKARGAAGQLKQLSGPVGYIPPGMSRKSLERCFDVSSKALFHVMFGEKSTVFQTLYAQRRDQPIHQGHWKELDKGKAKRQFAYRVASIDMFGRTKRTDVVDHQTIEKQEDHLCYVVNDIKTPWHLPHRQDFIMVSKIVITHVAKSKSKLSIWTRVDWFKDPKFSKSIVQKQALGDLDNDALDLGDVVAGAVRKLTNSKNADAVAMFGAIGGNQEPPPPPQPPTETSKITATAATTSFPISADQLRASRPIKQHQLSQMVLENGLSLAESAISNLIMFIIAAVKKSCNIVSAHRVLLLLLTLSVAANMSLSTRSTRAFWSERRANRFLEDVQVRPNGIMARSITLKDLDNAVAPLQRFNATGRCGSKFWQSPGAQAGQEKLGIVRHNLVVALRFVNGMERDMVSAEWERWVVQEMRRCRMVSTALGGLEGGLGEYCGDCEDAASALMKGSMV
ncbi:hypothetical protein BDD12DRAFT_829186 [Trichophaea hybrida]|nr:hypothetical protein BDD12DRAFT_829186 [Trichophaea hybrida]